MSLFACRYAKPSAGPRRRRCDCEERRSPNTIFNEATTAAVVEFNRVMQSIAGGLQCFNEATTARSWNCRRGWSSAKLEFSFLHPDDVESTIRIWRKNGGTTRRPEILTKSLIGSAAQMAGMSP